jgi:hypothetical protein
LGQGEFGLVVKAVLIGEGTADIPVAVKSIKGKRPVSFLSCQIITGRNKKRKNLIQFYESSIFAFACIFN